MGNAQVWATWVFFPGTPKGVMEWSRPETNTWRQQPDRLGFLFWSHKLAWLGDRLALQCRSEQSDLFCWKWHEEPSPTQVFSRSTYESLHQLGIQAATGLMANQCNTVSVGRSCLPAASISRHWHWEPSRKILDVSSRKWMAGGHWVSSIIHTV